MLRESRPADTGRRLDVRTRDGADAKKCRNFPSRRRPVPVPHRGLRPNAENVSVRRQERVPAAAGLCRRGGAEARSPQAHAVAIGAPCLTSSGGRKDSGKEDRVTTCVPTNYARVAKKPRFDRRLSRTVESAKTQSGTVTAAADGADGHDPQLRITPDWGPLSEIIRREVLDVERLSSRAKHWLSPARADSKVRCRMNSLPVTHW